MSMTLEQAIEHAEKVYEEKLDERSYALEFHDNEEAEACQKCADEHRQLAEWLKELQERRKSDNEIPFGNASFSELDCINGVEEVLRSLPPAQPERTCVNCGRTANNGGWYADGGTRCPIEEHYALPKDGFCHLWEKRNVTDDDYPERRTDE